MQKEYCNYDGLLAGEVQTVESIPVAASQTIKRGDLLESKVTEGTAATEFTKVSDVAKVGNIYRIAANDIDTTSGASVVAAYGAGYYNASKVTVSGDAKVNKMALRASGIILVNCQSGIVESED